MSTSAIAALERALQADDINAVRFEIMSALGSLRQQPGVVHDLQLHARIEREIRKFDSAAAAARAWGVPKQTLHAVRCGERPCPGVILRAIGLRRLPAGRALYQEI
jgi:hypothetical protein